MSHARAARLLPESPARNPHRRTERARKKGSYVLGLRDFVTALIVAQTIRHWRDPVRLPLLPPSDHHPPTTRACDAVPRFSLWGSRSL